MRLVFCRGRRRPGALTSIAFPTHADDLTPAALTRMLRHGGHLDERTAVASVRDRLATIRDGVKGDKAIIDVQYEGRPPAGLPSTFFVKFAVSKLSAMRVLCATSEVSECEALFYHELAAECPVPTPRCFFVDFTELTADFCLVSELVPFGTPAVSPLKHRVRDAPKLDELRRLVQMGGRLNCAFWGDAALKRGIRRFDATHRRAWPLMQMLSTLGLRHTTARTLKGRATTTPFMTWAAPEELIGNEAALIRDMPAILTSLCDEVELTAFGHNDIVADNAYFVHGDTQSYAASYAAGSTGVPGLFDWQQSCVNSIGQEWAWNWHFLPPEFLTAHEEELIDLLLATYELSGRTVQRADFLRHYALGCAQMYCFSGGGLQALMGRLDKRGILSGLKPDDARCSSEPASDADAELLELLVGAEMSRRAFTNACNIMRRHGFAREWQRWRRARGLAEV